jgi:hypothetical protein
MNYYYQRTFEAVRMSPEHQEQIRSALSSRFSVNQKEDNSVSTKPHSIKISRVLAIAAVAILALALVGFTYGSQIIKLLGGGRMEEGKDNAGNNYVSMDSGFVSDPVEVRDGQIYFVLDGSDTNITNQCSEKTYYQYESADANGYRHVVLIGGTPDDVGMAEFVWDESGTFQGSNATYNSNEEPAWLTSGKTALGVN